MRLKFRNWLFVSVILTCTGAEETIDEDNSTDSVNSTSRHHFLRPVFGGHYGGGYRPIAGYRPVSVYPQRPINQAGTQLGGLLLGYLLGAALGSSAQGFQQLFIHNFPRQKFRLVETSGKVFPGSQTKAEGAPPAPDYLPPRPSTSPQNFFNQLKKVTNPTTTTGNPEPLVSASTSPSPAPIVSAGPITGGSATRCTCVNAYKCDPGDVYNFGEGVIDVRLACAFGDVCCSNPKN